MCQARKRIESWDLPEGWRLNLVDIKLLKKSIAERLNLHIEEMERAFLCNQRLVATMSAYYLYQKNLKGTSNPDEGNFLGTLL